MKLRAAVLAALLIAPRAATAQDSAPAQTAAPDPDPQVDVMDVWRKLRDQPPAPEDGQDAGSRMIAAMPIVGWNPTFGFTFGAAAQIAFVAGPPETTRISSSVNSLSFSTNKDTLLNVRFSVYTGENRWFVEGDNRFYISGQSVYGLGTSTPDSAAIDAEYTFVRIRDTGYRRVGGPFYIGGGVLFDSYSNVRPDDVSDAEWNLSPYATYSQQHGLPLASQQSGGVSVNALFDRRIGEIDPRSGWMAQGWYRVSFDDFLGGDSSWQLAHVELRSYFPLGERARPTATAPGGGVPARHRLAIWTFADVTTRGAAPYFDLPETVSDVYGRSSRAYRQGRYRGERLAYGEVEYRGMLTRNGLLGMVAFANATTITNLEAGEKLFDSYAPAAGAGLRVLFNKRSRTNFCVDVAFGKDGASGLYFALQDAF
jgi:hypothetical protein